MTSSPAKRARSLSPPPYLPAELVGKIVGMAALPYDRIRMDEIGLNRDQRAYANLALRQREEQWRPMIDVVKETLTRLQDKLLEIEGVSNRFQPHDETWGAHPTRLLACWPRRWVFEELDELRSEIVDAGGSTMNTDMVEAVVGSLEYSYHTPRQHDGYEQDAKTLTVSVPRDRLPPTVTAAWMTFSEALVDYRENYRGEVNSLERSFCLAVRFVGAGGEDVYNIKVEPEHSSHPGHYVITPGWVSTNRYEWFMDDSVPVQRDREKKGPLGPHASAVSMIVRQLLLMEEARPFLYYASHCSPKEWKAELRSAGIHRLGVPDLMQ